MIVPLPEGLIGTVTHLILFGISSPTYQPAADLTNPDFLAAHPIGQ